MDDRLAEILDRLRDLDHRLARLEHGGPRGGPGWREERGHGPPHGGHGGPPGHHGGDGHDCGYRDEPRHHGGCRQHDCGHRGQYGQGRHGHEGGDFDEKRVIDTIVRLTCENLAPMVARIVSCEVDRCAPPAPPDAAKP